MNTPPAARSRPVDDLPPAAAARRPDGPAGAADERQRHLFRHTLREQLVNPLIHIMRTYRQERP